MGWVIDILLKIIPREGWLWIWRRMLPFLTGVLICAIVLFIYWALSIKPYLDDYHNKGSIVGAYNVSKGRHVIISVGRNMFVSGDNLKIAFYGSNYRTFRAGSGEARHIDSIFVFPSFKVNPGWASSEPIDRFEEGQTVVFSGENYDFTIELKELNTSLKDTVARFNVFRRVLPKYSNKAP